MTTSHPLSPIILSKLYSKEKKINISASLNKDIFSIYQIRDGTSNLNYCTQIIDYLITTKQVIITIINVQIVIALSVKVVR